MTSIKANFNGHVIDMTSPKEGQTKAAWVASNMRSEVFKDQDGAEVLLGGLYDKHAPKATKPATTTVPDTSKK